MPLLGTPPVPHRLRKPVQPVELRLPPSGVSDPTVGAKLLDVRRDGGNDRVAHVLAGGNPIGPTDELDPAYLFGKSRPIGAEVEPEEECVADISEASAWRSSVEVDDADRLALAKDEVAGQKVVVTDVFVTSSDFRSRRRVVEAPDEATSGRERLICDRWIEFGRDVPRQKAEHLTALFVTPEIARCRIEAALVELR